MIRVHRRIYKARVFIQHLEAHKLSFFRDSPFSTCDFCLLARQLNVTDYGDDDACYSKRALMAAALTYEGSFKGPRWKTRRSVDSINLQRMWGERSHFHISCGNRSDSISGIMTRHEESERIYFISHFLIVHAKTEGCQSLDL